jgi:hypothetical protein
MPLRFRREIHDCNFAAFIAEESQRFVISGFAMNFNANKVQFGGACFAFWKFETEI